MFAKVIDERKKVLIANGYQLEELKEYGRNWVSVRKGDFWGYVDLEHELDPKFLKPVEGVK